jgi:two-component system sensor histidine kinase DesK
MFRKIYPEDQINTYLIIDVIVIVSLFYNVLSVDSPVPIGVSLSLLAAFLFTYYMMLWYKDIRLLFAALTACSIFALFAIFYKPWLLLYGFIVSDFLGRAHAKRLMWIGVVGLFAMHISTAYALYGHWFTFYSPVQLPILILQLVLPFMIRIREKSKLLKEELDTANQKLERYIQEEERHRIARDLHDTLGQSLTMITMKSQLATRLVEKDADQAKKEMTEVMNTSRHVLKQVRELVTTMKFVSLEEEVSHAKEILSLQNITLDVKQEGATPQLLKVAESMLALSLREAVTNIIKHSKATHCTIVKEYANNEYKLQVIDNGIGKIDQMQTGNGITSIRERIHLLQGNVCLTSLPNGGMSITMTIPIHNAKRGATL